MGDDLLIFVFVDFVDNNKIPMTLRGYRRAQDELKHLKSVERPEIIQAIATAREFGDLSENAEYHAAKDKQGLVESRISELEEKLSRAEVFDTSKVVSDTIKFGATVTVVDEETSEEMNFQIVGSDEADIKGGLLPVTSPLSRALIGKAVGDFVEVHTPRGQKQYSVVFIKYV
jgi:transcription elongation factor GreA